MPRKINPNSLKNLEKRKPFVKGDPRINPGGKVKSFSDLRTFMQEVANEMIEDERKNKIARLREMVLNLSEKDFLEFAYGKVPFTADVNLRGELSWKSFIDGNGNSNTETSSDKS